MNKKFLFLDRDGVINIRTPGDYIKSPDEFIFCDGAVEAIVTLSTHFQRIIVVTNQAGIGKGLMTEDDLAIIHTSMLEAVRAAGGRIDAVFHCPDRPSQAGPCRKPDTGMAMQAQVMFPEIDFAQSWMVGDSVADIEFGKRLGMKTALVQGKFEEAEILAAIPVDWRGESLEAFAFSDEL